MKEKINVVHTDDSIYNVKTNESQARYSDVDFMYDGALITIYRLSKERKVDIEYLKELYKRYVDYGVGNTKHGKDVKRTLDNAVYGEKQRIDKELNGVNKELYDLEKPEELSNEEKKQIAKHLLDTKFKKFVGRSGTNEILIIKDVKEKLVERVMSRQAIDDTLINSIAGSVESESLQTLSPTFIRQIKDYWLMYGERVEKFDTFGGFDSDTWCIGKCLVRPSEEEKPMPYWDKFLSRLNDKEAYAAWIYGVASKRYRGRQVLWLHGEMGEDGKTYQQKFIAKHLFPNVSHPMANSAFGDGARFIGAEFEGKALAYWDDCPNTMALFREDVKQLSSGVEGNPMRIEHKGVGAYDAQLETRMWINSNSAPCVSHDNFIQSRLLYIKMAEMNEEPDLGVGVHLLDELPGFLWYAKQCYESLCTDNRKIVQNEEALTAIQQFAEEFEYEYEQIFEKYFFVTDREDDYVVCTKIADILKEEGIKKNIDVGRFYDWLKKRKHLIRKYVYVGSKRQRRVLSGIKLCIS